jgi:transcriptional regulator with XRE-family HTH domain
MFDQDLPSLATYLRSMMEQMNYPSVRSFAFYLGISHTTLNRLLRGDSVEREVLQKIAEALHVPVENLYRMTVLRPTDLNRHVDRWMVELLRASEGTPDQSATFDELKERIAVKVEVIPIGSGRSIVQLVTA